jgi:hypothetical protein
MSYDLYLYKKKNKNITENDIAAYLDKNLPFNKSESDRQWDYENPETGVYFMIDWNEPNTEKEDLEAWDSFDNFEYLNFSLSINFFRPTYFGMEIFPIIETMIKKLDLYILNSQDEIDSENPLKFNDGYLQDQWTRHNNKVSIDHFNELEFKYMPLEKSNYMWWYLLHHSEMEQEMKEDIFIPRFFVVENHEDYQLYTACVWTNNLPIVLPKVDYVIIRKKYTKFFKSIEEDGFVAYETVIKELGNFFDDFDYLSIPDLKILRQQNADRMANKFNSLKIFKSIEDFGVSVGKDGFVNVRPE